MANPVKLGTKAVRAARAARHLRDSLGEITAPGDMLGRARTLPIQRSVDVAVPIDVAWDHWIEFQHLPEGTHRVTEVERDDDGHLVGRLDGAINGDGDWEAEIL